MLEEIRNNFQKLVSMYETEKQRADALAEKLVHCEEKSKLYKEQITELNQQIDNLKLRSAFTAGGDNSVAKASIDKLIREIDKCVKALEK